MAYNDTSQLDLLTYYMTVRQNDPLTAKVIECLLMLGNPIEDVPMTTNKRLDRRFNQLDTNGLPATGWVPIGTDPSTIKAKPTAREETAYRIANLIKVPTILLDTDNADDPRKFQIKAAMIAAHYQLLNDFFNNAHLGATGNDNNGIVGLRSRLDTGFNGADSTCKFTGSSVDMSSGGMTATTANTFFEQMQQQLDVMNNPDGNGVTFYCNRLLKRRIDRAAKVAGPGAGFSSVKDQIGRKLSMFNNAKIKAVGPKQDQTTEVITSTEDTSGVNGSSNYTSLYAVDYSEDKFAGWQFAPLKATHIGVDDIDENDITKIQWVFGLMQLDTRAVSRQYAIKVS